MSLPLAMSAPPPNLRIVPTERLHPHEEHDTQRLLPLIDRLKHETVMINPPIVAPMDADGEDYVVLDGANRTSAFSELGFPHVLVQIAPYGSDYVQLETWHHVVCGWSIDDFLHHLDALAQLQLHEGGSPQAVALASIQFRSERLITLTTNSRSARERNRSLVEFVSVYQRNAVLQRTAITEPGSIWSHHPDGIALVVFPRYRPSDVITAAREHAFIPPGITRHIIQGRALRVNYPLEVLRDPVTPLEEKNRQLVQWTERKFSQRQVRYYAESTYQFDE
ncbi:MAG: hypothetical protein U0670_00370 [Anaerolineae bacterium]